jgi:hypothetical protein
MKTWLLLAFALAPGAWADEPPPQVSPARSAGEAGLTDIRSLVPDIAEDIRYAQSDNFTGAPVDGYRAPKCFLRTAAAQALARVETTLRKDGYRLRLWDCYRPARAVTAFVHWAGDLSDTRTKTAHYPNLGKDASSARWRPKASSTIRRSGGIIPCLPPRPPARSTTFPWNERPLPGPWLIIGGPRDRTDSPCPRSASPWPSSTFP